MGTALKKSVLDDAQAVQKAAQLIALGARLQVIQSEFPQLSRDRCLSIYKEVKGEAPQKGPLPFSTEWFLFRAPNAHASLFMSIYNTVECDNPQLGKTDVLIAAYTLYLQTVQAIDNPPILSMTRAWSLFRHVASGVLRTITCHQCQGNFVVDPYDVAGQFQCALCDIQSRPGPKICFDNKHYQRYLTEEESEV
ncbi:flagellar transcriptional regulator FlhC [Limnobacter humi]|uniref:Flagellar transcriptional regulator FlhC n=1 Tax=Limnobacter humi TaxID=1778671 RepID=A0ABT1WJ50_9BURK|nr:FlhC family transcriptional regulator [Limnobacter humi]MCQ8897523.1 flagellar transcriptional regulator FlhC [Limnobacter humi]